MSYGMNQDENREVISFPKRGMRATDVPQDTLQFKLNSGLVRYKDNGEYKELSTETSQIFQKVRSMLIYSDVDFSIQGVYSEDVHVQAGWNAYQELPETEDFSIDTGDISENYTPEGCNIQVFLFNTPRLPMPEDFKKARGSRDNEVDVNGEWAEALRVPAFPYDQKAVNITNTGSNELEIRYKTKDAGKERQQNLTDSSATKKIAPGEHHRISEDNPTDQMIIDLRNPSGNPTTAELEYTGEN